MVDPARLGDSAQPCSPRRVPILSLCPAEHSTFAPLRAGPAQPALLVQPKGRCSSQAKARGTGDTWGKPAATISCSGHEEQINSSPAGCREGAAAPRMAPSHISSQLAACPMKSLVPLPPGVHLPFSSDVLMINTLVYPQSLPILSSAFTTPNFLKASQGALKEDHSSLQALSCSISGCVFCTQAPQSFCSWNLLWWQLGACRVGWEQAHMKKGFSMSQNCPIPSYSLQSPWVLGQAEVFPAGAAWRLALS